MGAVTPPNATESTTDPGGDRPVKGGKRGRPATASPDDVLAVVTQLYLDGQRVDITVVAARLGLGRATIYRWFGSRERLLGEVVAQQLEFLVARKRAEVRRRGAAGVLEVLDRVNRTLTRSRAVRRLLEQERDSAMRMLTSSAGVVEPRAVACVQSLIENEIDAGRYQPTIDPATLAYALVRLRHAFLYHDTAVGIRGDYERLREVQAALLGIAPRGASARARTRLRASGGANRGAGAAADRGDEEGAGGDARGRPVTPIPPHQPTSAG